MRLGKRASGKKTRGLGLVYRPKYIDRETGERKTAATWWIQFSIRGVRYRESSRSTNRADAVRLLKHRLSEGAAGKPVGAQLERTTFEDLVRILLDNYRANERRSLRRVEGGVKHLREFFGDYRAVDITEDRINSYVVYRKQQKAANATINRELAALKRAFRLAGRKVGELPRFQMLRESNTRKGFFEAEQFQSVLQYLPDALKPVFQVAYITGWRVPSEILTRRWQHVDFEGNWLRLEPGETKNEEGRMFPLMPELREVLATQRERTRQLELATGRVIPWVFHREGKPIKDFYTGWDKACRLAGYPDRVAHDLRRTAVRNLERAGVARSAAMRMTGHKTESIYRRYAIVDETMLRESAEKLAAYHATARNNRKVLPIRKSISKTPVEES